MTYIPSLSTHRISSVNSTTALLTAGSTFTGEWEDVIEYATVGATILGSISTDGTLYFDLSTDGGTTYTSVPNTIGDATFAIPRILNVVESHVRIRYVNGSTNQTGTFSVQTKYSNAQQMTLLTPVDSTINSEDPSTPVRPTNNFDLDAARQHITGQRAFFFFGFKDVVTTSPTWTDVHPTTGDITWLTSSVKVDVYSSDAADTSAGLGVQSVELHGLSDTGVDQDEVIVMNGTTPVTSSLTYRRINKLHSETCGTYGGSHQGNICCSISGDSSTILSQMIGEEGSVDTAVVYGSGEAGNGYWSVPLGKVMYITRLEVIPDVSGNKTMDVSLYERENILDTTTPFAPRRVIWAAKSITSSVVKEFKSHIKIKGLTDIWFRATASGASAIEVSLDFYLVDSDSEGA